MYQKIFFVLLFILSLNSCSKNDVLYEPKDKVNAYKLYQEGFDLFEKGDHFGGHAYTIDLNIDKNDKQFIPIDIGFIVFNHYTYPNLIEFFKQNKVEIEKSNMSFSVTTPSNEVEYCGKGLNGMFSTRKNLLNFKFLKMFLEIIKFYKRSSNLNLKDNK